MVQISVEFVSKKLNRLDRFNEGFKGVRLISYWLQPESLSLGTGKR